MKQIGTCQSCDVNMIRDLAGKGSVWLGWVKFEMISIS